MQRGLERSTQRSRRQFFRPTAARDLRSGPPRTAGPPPDVSLGDRISILNARILEWVEASDEPADLVCECSDPRCFSVVTTTPAAYRRIRDEGGHLSAPGD